MSPAVLLGDPSRFRIRSGSNPHTRDRWGRRKRVDLRRAVQQWDGLREALEGQGVRVHVVPADENLPGMVFPANAGFRFGDTVFLSNLNPSRAGEREHYRREISSLGLRAADLPTDLPFEGEADFIPVGHPSGDPGRTVYLFTHGRLERPRWAYLPGIPPYRRVYGFRSDYQALGTLQSLVRPLEVLPLELCDERYYHGDTVLCSFGPNREFLLCYLPGLTEPAQAVLRQRFGDRVIPLSVENAAAFAANSFQVPVEHDGERRHVLLVPDGVGQGVYEGVRRLGVIPFPVDVSEFREKGGGAVKCMLLDLGQLP